MKSVKDDETIFIYGFGQKFSFQVLGQKLFHRTALRESCKNQGKKHCWIELKLGGSVHTYTRHF